jgi:multiple sugar transport system permease protein
MAGSPTGAPPAVLALRPKASRRPLLRRLMNSPDAFAALLLAPAGLILLFVFVYPLAQTLVYSLQSINLMNPAGGTPFVGLQNFGFMLNHADFWSSVQITTELTVSTVALQLVIGMLFALLLAEPFFGSGIVRGLYLLPWALPAIVVAFGWRMYLVPGYGLFDTVLAVLLQPFGLAKQAAVIDWFGQPTLALLSVTGVVVWKGLPFAVIVFLAGLQSIPADLEEAARVDGASGFQEFWHIKLPQLRLLITIVVLLHIIGTFNGFDLPFLLTQGGPENSTMVLAIQVYNQAFVAFQEGRAAALAVMMLLVLGAFAYFLLMAQTREERA